MDKFSRRRYALRMDTSGKYRNLVHGGKYPGRILVSSEQISRRIRQLADEIAIDYDSYSTPAWPALTDDQTLCGKCGEHHPAGSQCPRRFVPQLSIVAVMTGAMFITADLVRSLPHMLKIHLMDISSYTGETAGELKFNTQLADEDIAGRDILIIDDILDSGRTLGALAQTLIDMRARSVRTCVLVSKPQKLRGEAAKCGEQGQCDSSGKPGQCDATLAAADEAAAQQQNSPLADTNLIKRDGKSVLVRANYVGFEIPDEFVVGYGMDFDDKYRNLPDICVLTPE